MCPLLATSSVQSTHDARRSLHDSLKAVQTSGDVSFEEKRALRWLSDAKNAAPPRPAVVPLPVDEVTTAAPPASPAACAPQPAEALPIAVPEPDVAEAAAAPEVVPAAEDLQVAPFACSPAHLLRLLISLQAAQVELMAPPASAASLEVDLPHFPSALLWPLARRFGLCA